VKPTKQEAALLDLMQADRAELARRQAADDRITREVGSDKADARATARRRRTEAQGMRAGS
jgi:hypothetical protein